MICLFDVDGVLGDIRTISEEILRRHLRAPDYKLPLIEKFTDELAPSLRDVLHLHWEAHGFASKIAPFPDAKEAFQRLRKRHHEMVALTAHWNAPTWVYDRCQWLVRHYRVDHTDQVHTSRKDIVYGDILVEDSSEHGERWLRRHPKGRLVLVNRYGVPRFKRPVDGHPRVIVVSDLSSLPEIVSNLKES